MELHIPQSIFESIVGHAEDAAPAECCGYLATEGQTVRRQFPLTNLDKSATHYTMDPAEQFGALQAAREEGLKLGVVYHSHPDTPPRMSNEDLRLAHDEAVIYLIYSRATEEARAYTVINHAVDQEVSLQIISDGPDESAEQA